MFRQILSTAVGLMILTGIVACAPQAPEHPLVTAVDGEVRIPVAQVNDGDAHFFTYKQGDRNINFFARTDGSGKILTHFDACYSCYKYKKGYVQEDREVVCIACRIGYDLDQEIWDWVGPCVPVTLKSEIVGGILVVTEKKLKKGAKLF